MNCPIKPFRMEQQKESQHGLLIFLYSRMSDLPHLEENREGKSRVGFPIGFSHAPGNRFSFKRSPFGDTGRTVSRPGGLAGQVCMLAGCSCTEFNLFRLFGISKFEKSASIICCLRMRAQKKFNLLIFICLP